MSDVGKRFAGPTTLTATAATYYTVPADTKAILRYISFTNVTAVDHTVTFSFGADATGTRIYDQVEVAARGVVEWEGLHILETTEVLQAFADAADAVNITASGIEEVTTP